MNERKIRGTQMLLAVGFIMVLYISRLFYLQVVNEEFALEAQVIDLKEKDIIPARGNLYDRHEKLYVDIIPMYDFSFIPNKLRIPAGDTTILTQYLGLEGFEIRRLVDSLKKDSFKSKQEHPLASQVSVATYGALSEHLWRFEGIVTTVRPTRKYNYPVGAHMLGYIGKISPRQLAKAGEEGDTIDFKYSQQDLVGRTGLENFYEKILRGRKGKRMVMMDTYNREIGAYAEGRFDEEPRPGRDLRLGVDVDLQAFGEQLMQNKRGSVVAIEPATGEILAFVSSPGYDPSLLTGSELGKNHMALERNTLQKPLINRPISAQYSPGSIFKILQALAALSEGIITAETYYGCGGAWSRNKGKPKCHGAHGSVNVIPGIQHSCNAYFAEVYYQFLNHEKFKNVKEAYDRWYSIMSQYGIGKPLGVDLYGEKGGFLPTSEYYDKHYRAGAWGALTVYSNSIGQGEILMTPLQMANVACLLANRGYYVKPHFVKAVRGERNQWEDVPYERVKVPGTREHFELVIEGMSRVVEAGTARLAQIDSIEVCGKTGTVQNPGGEDHSVFIAFAPRENPKIAIGCIVENVGFGGTWAAPISSLMMEKYLTGKIKDPAKLQRIVEKDFLTAEIAAARAAQIRDSLRRVAAPPDTNRPVPTPTP